MIRSLIQLSRPQQWTKNLLCLAGAVFSGRMSDPAALGAVLATMFLFCIGSSATYIFNDIWDRDRDRKHPRKSKRPLASGRVSVSTATMLCVLLTGAALAGTWWLGIATFVCMGLFIVLNIAYTTTLKHVALLDVMCIAMGFVLRLCGGVYVLNLLPTTWITLCTFFLALFLGFAKRRAELNSLTERDTEQRPVLDKYSVAFLDELLSSAATITIISYALFTVASGKNPSLILSLPFVYFGVMSYKGLVTMSDVGEEPEKIVFTDSRVLVTVVLWLVSFLAIEYWDPQLFTLTTTGKG